MIIPKIFSEIFINRVRLSEITAQLSALNGNSVLINTTQKEDMLLLLSAILGCLASSSIASEGRILTERDLRRYLFADYDKLVRPVTDPHNAIVVYASITPIAIKSMKFRRASGTDAYFAIKRTLSCVYRLGQGFDLENGTHTTVHWKEEHVCWLGINSIISPKY
ncbi:hypothetical protein NPIL_243351 [Nephila pilipes]|uniref:Uncharacterized protein n=1 Tax=Nephila pilipes TaxID=299642 RepID=A0A8X6QFT3_NEPPI|nr:hypothetical protein NPIL_243351 [Nephila pilipes]